MFVCCCFNFHDRLGLMYTPGAGQGEEGKALRFVGTLMDITEQERTTRELWRREAYLAQAQALSQRSVHRFH